MSDCESIEARVKALEDDSERNRTAHKEYYDRIRELEKVSMLNRQMIDELQEIKTDVKELKEKPARRWENAVNIIMQALILAALAALNLAK